MARPDAPLPRHAGEIALFLLDRSHSTERRQAAIDLRTEQRALALLKAAKTGRASIELLDKTALLEHSSSRVRDAAKRLLGD